MEDMRDSTAVSQIVKIVRMVVKFHPLLTITSLIFKIIFLQDWIEEEMNNHWKILKVYCQSIMRALLDPVTKKMKNLSKALQIHFNNEAAKGQLKAKLIAKLALFFATFLLLDTELGSNIYKRGVKTQLLFVGLHMLDYSKLWSELRILRGSCGCTTNSTSNFTLFILALLFAKFYDNSLRSLSSMLCIAVFFLSLLVVLRPQTDLGLFSFIIGVIGSITYNCYEFKFPTWIIAFICFVLFSFKSWIDKYWLDLEEDPSTNTTVGSTSVFLIFSSAIVQIALAIFVSSAVKSPLSDYKNWLVKAISTVLWTVRLQSRIGSEECKDKLLSVEEHVLLDIRPDHHYKIVSIPKSLNIPLSSLEVRLPEVSSALNEEEGRKGKNSGTGASLYVICRRGNDSQRLSNTFTRWVSHQLGILVVVWSVGPMMSIPTFPCIRTTLTTTFLAY
ncbi:hypothetical protein SLEP1_g28184 [Rubroshorea leprosula]|uniref:Rhodanese domain-containing protein n=1 Tax=Rubroshorea leprosula TaxID=152421 RepID=A0AAV5K1I9_9ROSI|nr:hypothetical protein SLEP1_g28184 [Rubroshorea leprosula]